MPTSLCTTTVLAHAFVNTVLVLDYDRAGFPYPFVGFQVNCYGRRVIAQKGFRSSLANPLAETDLNPSRPRQSAAGMSARQRRGSCGTAPGA